MFWGVGAPPVAGERFVDQVIYRETTEDMRRGDGYYAAMDRALRETNGPAESARAFRLPGIFLLWRVLPSQGWVWALFVLVVAATSFAILQATTVALVAPAFAAYVFRLARPYSFSADSWLDQYLLVELWALPLLVGAVVAWRRERRGIAVAGFALAATLVRELVVGLLLTGLVVAWRRRRPAWPWAVALLAAVAMAVAHVRWADPHLVAHGAEEELLGSGQPPWTITAMMATGLPAPLVVGPLLWFLSIRRLWRLDRELLAFLAPLLALPLSGLLIGRDYWGFLVAPLLLWLALEEIADAVRSRRGVSGKGSPFDPSPQRRVQHGRRDEDEDRARHVVAGSRALEDGEHNERPPGDGEESS